jgi:2'-5' RNA ligase
VARWLAEHGGFQGLTFTANRFVLLSSKDSVGGGPYLVEEAYPLDKGGGEGGYAQAGGLVAPFDRW